ncbi:uncharacterized protein MONOS_9921 [Monocercomonoides exilis]|uniref:uncharacterized protein n=1 Tax=Monocercomonoides exilis TaxID=2049356 RepID=UPI00355ABCD9|nr:hypothetical protein MONOS_9921 [Monocercomonoides exilis]|eukprot:MONOS_9921.1-p1 / transcript=MONOS_9921.1 / gene=MONOS_9921 / organism=Monocercomonoides_exilis_PA203 / gene_product=unspecified product / transcript_product=unspecified product / location=Mono_scaffold00427:32216-32431(-) / protein_length=72 / sequence_SO=supercontig / SO=protein_coding / is_pseudo=false
MVREECEACERTGGAAAGEGQDHPDAGEEDPGAEREVQCRGEGAAGAAGGDEGEDGTFGCGDYEGKVSDAA